MSERARQIDQQEFAAECAAIRQRAFERPKFREMEERAKVEAWLSHPLPLYFKRGARLVTLPQQEPEETLSDCQVETPTAAAEAPSAPKKPGVKATPVTCGGRTMTALAWAEHLGIALPTFHSRIRRLGSVEAAIEAGGPAFVRKQSEANARRNGGYQPTSRNAEGTGAGSFILERAELANPNRNEKEAI